jgi:glyoxylase-like metal-dependent hydrolase (beta-lactamase superfamily II)
MLGLDIGRIEDVIITHMHFDHCGNHHLFPIASSMFRMPRWSMPRADACVTGRSPTPLKLTMSVRWSDACLLETFNPRQGR